MEYVNLRRPDRTVCEAAAQGTDSFLPGVISEKERLRLVRQHGTFALAYSAAFQSGINHFGGEDGFIAYKQIGSTAFVLSDPVAPRGHIESLIRRFAMARSDACFWQISRPVAETLARYDYRVSEMGIETRIALDKFGNSSPAKRNIRRAINRAARGGTTIAERSLATLDYDELNSISKRWRQSRRIKSREMTFLTRPAILSDEVDVRKFFAFDRDGKLQAFAFFDPIYENGAVSGYLCSAKRRHPESDSLIGYALLHAAVEIFRNEGRRTLSLGLSPLCSTKSKDVISDGLIALGFRLIYRNWLFNEFVYPLRGLATHKGSFRGSVEPVYCAFKRGRVLSQLLKMPKASNTTWLLA